MAIESLLKSLSQTLFGQNKSLTEDISVLANNNPSETNPSDISIVQAGVKSYLGVSSGRRNIPYKIQDLLSGKKDNLLKSKDSSSIIPSPMFECHYILFSANSDEDTRRAAIETGLSCCGEKTAYILELAFPPQEVKAFAARGQFSETIIRAYNAAEFAAVVLSNGTSKKLSEIEVHQGKLFPEENRSITNTSVPSR